MAINRQLRSSVAIALRAYLRGEIGSLELDCLVSPEAQPKGVHRFHDETCQAIMQATWGLIDVQKNRFNRGSHQWDRLTTEVVERWIALLKTDFELTENPLKAPRNLWERLKVFLGIAGKRLEDEPYWPLQSADDWLNLSQSHREPGLVASRGRTASRFGGPTDTLRICDTST